MYYKNRNVLAVWCVRQETKPRKSQFRTTVFRNKTKQNKNNNKKQAWHFERENQASNVGLFVILYGKLLFM